jgi:lysophospholipase L1-like esterase
LTRALCSIAFLFILLVPHVAQAQLLELRDGDRVVLLGNAFIEREQSYGYWELMLTSQFPKRHVIFRNLGWSGDTVWGEARAGFGTAADGFRALVEHVGALKPTVIILGYGQNEAFAGTEGLPRFIEGFKALLAALEPTKARIVLLAPPEHEKCAPPLPDLSAQNKNLWHYRDAMHEVAVARDLLYVDLDDWLLPFRQRATGATWTDDGIHFTQFGYWVLAAGLENELRLPPSGWSIEFDAEGQSKHVANTTVSGLEKTVSGLRFQLESRALPTTAPMRDPGRAGVIRIRGLSPGRYSLAIAGKKVVAATADDWAKGLAIDNPLESQQIQQLRQAIVKKNELYFHRWRPQNQTYLFGFRKHEQGRNAAEIVEFDPLIAEQEKEVARLRVPVAYRYEIAREVSDKP